MTWHNTCFIGTINNKSICQQIYHKLGYENFKEMHFNLSFHDNLEASKKLSPNLIDLGNVFGISLNLNVFVLCTLQLESHLHWVLQLGKNHGSMCHVGVDVKIIVLKDLYKLIAWN